MCSRAWTWYWRRLSAQRRAVRMASGSAQGERPEREGQGAIAADGGDEPLLAHGFDRLSRARSLDADHEVGAPKRAPIVFSATDGRQCPHRVRGQGAAPVVLDGGDDNGPGRQ